jgi:hypothetical protein
MLRDFPPTSALNVYSIRILSPDDIPAVDRIPTAACKIAVGQVCG